MKVYFSHGKESGPWGSKIKVLAELAKEQGYEVDSIDYTGILDPDQRVELLVNNLKNEQDNFLLVGSSMGGYVSLIASDSINAKGIFLLAPALYIPDYEVQEYNTQRKVVEVVHGWSDDIIPPENSIRFSQRNGCALHLIPGDHRLNSSMNIIKPIFRQFLASMAEST